MSVTVEPRCNGDTCVKCRRKFKRGDRVQVIHIVEKIGPNPNNLREVGSWLSPEFELAHANCEDAGLDCVITVRSPA